MQKIAQLNTQQLVAAQLSCYVEMKISNISTKLCATTCCATTQMLQCNCAMRRNENSHQQPRAQHETTCCAATQILRPNHAIRHNKNYHQQYLALCPTTRSVAIQIFHLLVLKSMRNYSLLRNPDVVAQSRNAQQRKFPPIIVLSSKRNCQLRCSSDVEAQSCKVPQ